MSQIECIECDEAKQLLDQGAVLFDIRDQDSFNQAHPNQALNLNNDNFQQLLSPLSAEQDILVLCYHGISSQGAAQYIAQQGFKNTRSVNGGFNQWQQLFPNEIKTQ